ncbi:hypothetical protein [Hathewaya massiliensis]|uniref:hypothetical protein n=1 Tax=Hathewaya massiliensis TaxID=1964382 RepID=UPI00115738A6|nr:hypothetical protein [Hathewaya massiliensis]
MKIKDIIRLIENKKQRERAEKLYEENKQYFETILEENNDLSENEIIEILIEELTEVSAVEFYEGRN